MHYKEVNETSTIDDKIDYGDEYYPTVLEMDNSNACIKEYQRIKPDGYVLIGYSLFDNDGKMSQGLVIQAGMKLGAHKILLSRENSHSGSLGHHPLLPDEKAKSGPIVEALVSQLGAENGNPKNHVHLALFLVQRNSDKE